MMKYSKSMNSDVSQKWLKIINPTSDGIELETKNWIETRVSICL